MEEDMITLPLEIKEDSLIKVVGVGGGGGNAVDSVNFAALTSFNTAPMLDL